MVATARQTDTILAPDAFVDTPQLIVSEEIMHRNIAEMASFARSVNVGLRPHIKTHKTPQITRLQIAAGAIGITCAKVGEAAVMIEQAGVEDVLLAYPIYGEAKYRRIVELLDRAQIAVAVDSLDAVKLISSTMTRYDRHLPVYIEVNTGQNRSGVMAGDEAVELAKEIDRRPSIRLHGVFTHEGHVNSMNADVIAAAAIEAGNRLVDTAQRIRTLGIPLPVVSVGSTPAAHLTPTVPGVTEMRPGTYVFNDNSLFRFGDTWGVGDCAARFAVTVVSHAGPNRCIIDAGSKTLAMDPGKGHEGHGYIVDHPDVIINRLSEEHGDCTLPDDEPGFAIGDRLEIIPNHICPTVNLMDEMAIVRNGHIVDHWRIAARGKVR